VSHRQKITWFNRPDPKLSCFTVILTAVDLEQGSGKDEVPASALLSVVKNPPHLQHRIDNEAL
jgi:hypothetical protein